jgi:hypothetical protein
MNALDPTPPSQPVMTSETKPWYTQPWATWVALVFCMPLGWVLLWRYQKWGNGVKAAITVASLVFLIYANVTKSSQQATSTEEKKQGSKQTKNLPVTTSRNKSAQRKENIQSTEKDLVAKAVKPAQAKESLSAISRGRTESVDETIPVGCGRKLPQWVQNLPDFTYRSGLDSNELSGPVHSVVWSKLEGSDKKVTKAAEFDLNGNLTKFFEYRDSGEQESARAIYSYSGRKRIKEEWYRQGRPDSTKTYFYSEGGKIERETWIDEKGEDKPRTTHYVYDTDGNQCGAGVIRYRLKDSNSVVVDGTEEVILFSKGGSEVIVVSTMRVNGQEQKVRTVYNGSGARLSQEWKRKDFENLMLYQVKSSTYSLLTSEYFNDHSLVDQDVDYEYEFDERGNWLVKTRIAKPRATSKTQDVGKERWYRQIEYY